MCEARKGGVLHYAARWGNSELIKSILAPYPESAHLRLYVRKTRVEKPYCIVLLVQEILNH